MVSSDKALFNLLTSIGFSGAEVRVYNAMLTLDSVSVRKVAEVAGINRGTTYEIIKRLVASGLVSTYQKGLREYFTAESPETLLDLIAEQKRSLNDAERLANVVVPKLLAAQPQKIAKAQVRYFEDDEGVTAILRDVLATVGKLENKEYYVYSAKYIRSYLYRQFPQFTERRVAQGVFVKVIALGTGGDPERLSERRWVAENPAAAPTGSYMIIYGNKVAHISLEEDFRPYGVVIEDQNVAALQQLLFAQLWQSLE